MTAAACRRTGKAQPFSSPSTFWTPRSRRSPSPFLHHCNQRSFRSVRPPARPRIHRRSDSVLRGLRPQSGRAYGEASLPDHICGDAATDDAKQLTHDGRAGPHHALTIHFKRSIPLPHTGQDSGAAPPAPRLI
jgi:hypothetical protein